jgi:long-chain acyl-CoA synthetase
VATTAKRRGVSLKSAKFCICGAMNLPAEVAELWESMAGGRLIEGYGMTEASPVVFGNPTLGHRVAGTVGIPFPSTYGRVVDPDDVSVEIEPGKGLRGELLVKGPQVFSGYWNNPDETSRVLLPDGWLRTGDVVVQDADGFTAIVDRVKELIITGGFNVSPSEVEAVLRSHPDVVDAAVVGLPTALGGERVAAAVQMRDGSHFDEATLRGYAKGRLAAYKVPRQIVAVPELPQSMLGKVLRKVVRESLMSGAVGAE